MFLSKIKACQTYYRCMNELKEYGYIGYTPSSDPSTGSRVVILCLKKNSMCMEALFIPNEGDFKRWVREALKEYYAGDSSTTADPD